MSMAMADRLDGFYQSERWKKLRNKVRAQWKAANRPCAFCKAPLDFTVRRGQRAKAVVDHIQNRAKRPDLALTLSNLQMVCHSCNTKKASWVENNKVKPTGMDGFPEGWS